MTSATQDYVRQIVRRGREPMDPVDFEVDWNDSPLRHQVFTGVPRLPIPDPVAGASLWRQLESCLRCSYTPIARRTRISANIGFEHQQTTEGAIYGRGSASGGGMYPVELYFVIGAGHGLPAGVYHYSTAHHMLDQLLLGDYRDRVAATLRPGGPLPEVYVLAAVNFWKNSFKYNSFCYHVVTTDIGTLFGAWHAALGDGPEVSLWFDEQELDDLLGLDPDIETVFAVTSFGQPAAEGESTRPAATTDRSRARVTAGSVQRSRRTQLFSWNQRLQAEMLADAGHRPERSPDARFQVAGGPRTLLPAPRRLEPTEWCRATPHRRSSFGLFTERGGLALQELSDLLANGAGGRLIALPDDPPEVNSLLRFSVFANHVTDLPPGAFHYVPGDPSLSEVPGEAIHPFLQYNYYLTNYNLEQAAAAIVISGRPEQVVESLGPRGYRLLNAELGAAAQRLYVTAASLGLGCGAVFGFDNVSLRERLGQDTGDEWPLLMVMVGRERTGAAQFRYVLSTAEEST